ncbi:MAG: 30S ribosomal protein S1 [Victivallaceae bacterium]|nr:30S ribosomal protein S1 [Victivallaceae bacterium]
MAENNENSFLDFGGMPESMEGLLNLDNSPKKGEIVKGKISKKRMDGAMVDIGFKTDGFVPKEEFANTFEEAKEGDEIEVYIEEIENRQNTPTLSLEKARSARAWNRITTEYGEGHVVKGFMRKRVKGGIMVDIEGFPAFLPGSQLSVGPVRDIDEFIGKEFDVKIIKINTERRNIVVSKRELDSEGMREKREQRMTEMNVGDRITGVIKNITDFGAFIDLGGVDGLLHITDISWGRIARPDDVLRVGEEIEVQVIGIDRERGRVSLGLKQLSPNPWDQVADKYPAGTKIHGKVANVQPYGAFVELEAGVEGLIHVTEMSWTKRINRADDVLHPGDEVDAVVLQVDRESRRISLGMRQTERNPWEVLAEKYPKGKRIVGKVRNMTNYGAFVEIENDIDGMIHVSDMSWTRKINNPSELLKPGQEVEVVILDINPQQQRISLGLKQAEDDPWANIDAIYKVGDIVKGKVTKITQYGAFVELSNKIDGLIHISQISSDHVDKVRDVLNVDDEVEARVIKIDTDERRIGLSIRALDGNFDPDSYENLGKDSGKAEKPSGSSSHDPMVNIGDMFGDVVLGEPQK